MHINNPLRKCLQKRCTDKAHIACKNKHIDGPDHRLYPTQLPQDLLIIGYAAAGTRRIQTALSAKGPVKPLYNMQAQSFRAL
jgi:hypothetical protein